MQKGPCLRGTREDPGSPCCLLLPPAACHLPWERRGSSPGGKGVVEVSAWTSGGPGVAIWSSTINSKAGKDVLAQCDFSEELSFGFHFLLKVEEH